MNLFNREKISEEVMQNLTTDEIIYKQYLHKGICKSGPCGDKLNASNDLCCAPFIWCIHASDKLHSLPKHPNCDCTYKNLEIKPVGTISKRQPAPDVWLRMFGKLPDYYITKKEAEEKYGWIKGKNTLAGKAPGKMIGNELYKNEKDILPVKEGRIWYECDVDYESGTRSKLRLYYSNDGLMFFSPDHGEQEFYWIK